MKIKYFISIIVLLVCSGKFYAQNVTECDTSLVYSYGQYCEDIILKCRSFSPDQYVKFQKLRDSISVSDKFIEYYDIEVNTDIFYLGSINDENLNHLEKLRSYKDFIFTIGDKIFPIEFNQISNLTKRESQEGLEIVARDSREYLSIKYKLEIDGQYFGEQTDSCVVINSEMNEIRISKLSIKLNDNTCFNRVTFPDIVIVLN